MIFRKSAESDVSKIISIIKQAQANFKAQGIDQWQNGYPNEEVIMHDIQKEESYVLVKDDEVLATIAISFNKEKSYMNIIEGEWLTDGDYGVIHRIAVNNNYKGLGLSHKLLKYTEEICLESGIHSIKLDTHEDNTPMRSLLKKNGFEYCGIIYLESGGKRVAYEKTF